MSFLLYIKRVAIVHAKVTKTIIIRYTGLIDLFVIISAPSTYLKGVKNFRKLTSSEIVAPERTIKKHLQPHFQCLLPVPPVTFQSTGI